MTEELKTEDMVECTCQKVFTDLRGSRLVGRAHDPLCPIHGESESAAAILERFKRRFRLREEDYWPPEWWPPE